MTTSTRSMSNPVRKGKKRARQPFWSDYTDDELLDMRICDLGVRIEGSILENRIARMHDELAQRGLRFRPHCWLSDDWFSPDGIPGIAIPFYMAHPRLARLERNQMLEVEGYSQAWCMKILRHEAGHCVDTAYRLYRRRRWQQTFGKASEPYPDFYSPKPNSRSYVVHLESWYAQSHPSEDFAETFAVWLKPRSRWRSDYKDWPALEKLQYVNELMDEISEAKPPVSCRERLDPVRKIRKKLGEHYKEKRERYAIGGPTEFDAGLKRLFSDANRYSNNLSAAMFLRRYRRELREEVSDWTGQYQYTVDQVLKQMIDRSRELKLRLIRSERNTKQDALVMLTVQAMNYLRSGRQKVAL